MPPARFREPPSMPMIFTIENTKWANSGYTNSVAGNENVNGEKRLTLVQVLMQWILNERSDATIWSYEGAAREIVHDCADDRVCRDSFEQRRATGYYQQAEDQDGRDYS